MVAGDDHLPGAAAKDDLLAIANFADPALASGVEKVDEAPIGWKPAPMSRRIRRSPLWTR